MAEYRVEGPEIKTLLKVARKQPVPFAFNPAKKDEDCYLAMDRRKPAKVLGKEAKEGGEGAKFACGTMTLEGKLLSLTCERVLPALAKRLKKYFRTQKVKLNIEVLDEAGNVLESDIEDLPDDPELDDDLAAAPAPSPDSPDTASQTPADPAPGAGPETAGDGADAKGDPKALAARLNALQPAIKAQPPALAEKFIKVFKNIVEMIRKGQLDAAATGIDKLEAALRRSADAAQDGKAANAADSDQSSDKAEWDKVLARLMDEVPAALRGTVSDPGKLRAVFDFAQGKAEAGDYKAALRAAAALEDLMVQIPPPDDTPGDPANAAEEERPQVSPVAFQRARIMWLDSKKKMKSELDKLRAAIAQQSADDSDQGDILAVADQMLGEFDHLDSRLEDVLDNITNTEDGPKRSALRKQAQAVISDYVSVLGSPFFQSVDQNPFTSVSVTGPAVQSLGVIQKTLA